MSEHWFVDGMIVLKLMLYNCSLFRSLSVLTHINVINYNAAFILCIGQNES